MYVPHFRDLVVAPTLRTMGMYSESAVTLLLGTAAQESHFKYLHQLGAGPAVSFYQIEPATAADVVLRYLQVRSGVREQFEKGFRVLNSHAIDWANVDLEAIVLKLVTDLRFATAVARIKYLMIPAPLPKADDIPAMALYWKLYYNTMQGKGTEAEFINNYNRYVRPYDEFESSA